ncbi:MAG: aminotransferase-like domain-containing protein [Anaerolineae bacterium]
MTSFVDLASPRRWFLYEQVADNITRLIERGTYRPGDRIPSVRQLSQRHGISISTVLQAYYLLEDRGLIEARPQSGYFVRAHLPTPLPEPGISAPMLDPTQVNVRDLAMRMLHDTLNPHLLQFGAAIPHPDLLATKKLNRMMASIARRAEPQHSLYEFPPGCEALRVQIAQRALHSGCELVPEDVVITSGCVEAMDLCLRAVCCPGDTVAIESPIYYGILQDLESLGLRALEVPTHPRYGISLEALRFAIEHTPVRACLVISNFNNPLGSCIPDENKKELVALLARHDIPLIENDIYGELCFSEQRPTVAKAYDRKGLVMLCSSFSKDLAPGYRVGWVVPGRFKATIEWLKFTSSVATASLPQWAIAEFISSGGYEHHLRRIRRAYAERIARLTQAIERYFPKGTKVTRPGGGFVLWVELPERVDSLELYGLALNIGITLAPGLLFSAKQAYRNFVRLNAAYWSDQAEHAIKQLGDLILELARH